MKRPYQYQPSERQAIRARIEARGLTQERIAKELNRSQGAIARALRGERNTLLARIAKLLDRLDRTSPVPIPTNTQQAA
jgi:transcriptional regulator with XRE-family HTH domain